MYRISETPTHRSIFRVADCSWIPADPANTDYQAYLEWVAEGNEPEPWEPEQ